MSCCTKMNPLRSGKMFKGERNIVQMIASPSVANRIMSLFLRYTHQVKQIEPYHWFETWEGFKFEKKALNQTDIVFHGIDMVPEASRKVRIQSFWGPVWWEWKEAAWIIKWKETSCSSLFLAVKTSPANQLHATHMKIDMSLHEETTPSFLTFDAVTGVTQEHAVILYTSLLDLNIKCGIVGDTRQFRPST